MSNSKLVGPGSKSTDKRALRSVAQLDAAFVALLSEKPYDAITVSDIVRRAKIGRATFYSHYADKDALLRSQIDRIILPILEPSAEKPWLLDCSRFFEHAAKSRRIFRALTIGPAAARASRIVQDGIEAHVTELMKQRNPLKARFVATTIIAIVGWWVETGASLSISELQATYEHLVGHALASKASRDF